MANVHSRTWWLAGALALLLAGCSANGIADKASVGSPGSSHGVSRDGVNLVLSGLIEPGTAAAFAESWNALRDNGVVNPQIRLASPGGRIAEAFEIAGMLATVPQGAETVVPSGEACLSACTIIFLAGEHRFMGSGSALGFHGASKTLDIDIDFLPPLDRLIGTITIGKADFFVGRDESVAQWVADRAPRLATVLDERGAFDHQSMTTLRPEDAQKLGAAVAIP